jgi:hypothetical protein
MDSVTFAAAMALPAAAAVLLLPGFGVKAFFDAVSTRVAGWNRDVSRIRDSPERAEGLVVGMALSLVVTTVVGGLMLAFAAFSTTPFAMIIGVLALSGAFPFARWFMQSRAWWKLLMVCALAAPLCVSVFGAGYKPAQSYQWFYWQLGRQLATAGGVPNHVLEFGAPVRWQPDYLSFNFISQAFTGLMPGTPQPLEVAVWRLPLTLAVIAMTYLLMRLWFSRLPSVLAAAGLAASDLYIGKLGNNSPEALGLALGFVAVWLLVFGIRHKRVGLILLASITIGLDLSVHAIAATVCALLMVAAAVIEICRLERHRIRWLGVVTAAALLAGLSIVAVGVTLQGRSSPLVDSSNPARVDGSDPTFAFLQFSNGHFETPVTHAYLQSALVHPWSFLDLAAPAWWWVVALVGIGLIGAVRILHGPARSGVLTAVCVAVLLAAVILYFVVSADTYIPRHTGDARMAVYIPLLYVICLAAGAETIGMVVGAHVRGRTARVARVARAAVIGGVVLVITGLSAHVISVMAERPAISTTGEAALDELARVAPPGSVVVSNVATRGTIEYFTGLEAPTEGRQPLIEELDTLTSASEYLLTLHEFLDKPAPGVLEGDLGAGWLVLADDPRDFGTVLSYGDPSAQFANRAGLTEVWSDGGVRILTTPDQAQLITSVGRADPHPWFAAALVALLALSAAMVLGLGRWLSDPGTHVRSSTQRGRHGALRE